MTTDAIRSRAARVLASVLEIDPARLPETASMQTVDAWDSLAHVQLIMALEAEFEISFGLEQALQLTSLPAIHEALRRVQTRAAP
jgi:acyl carrier protein